MNSGPGSRTFRLTTAQALVRFLAAQVVERDGDEQAFFGGCFGIFGHGNVAGVGQALRKAAKDAAKTARMHGTPLYVWENGKVVARKP